MASDFNPQFQKIGEILIHAGKIDESHLSSALAEQKQTNEKIKAKLLKEASKLNVGPYTDEKSDFGPLNNKAHFEKVLGYIDTGEKEGAKLLADGRSFKKQGYENGYFVGPTIFDDVKPDMKIYKEEIKEISLTNISQTLSADIILKEESSYIDEVVVTGYTVERRRDLTGTIVKLNAKEITDMPTPSFEAALQGKAAGVQITQGSGIAGSSSVVRIRGFASISAGGDPLYVVDGIPITQDYFLKGNGGGMNNNPLATLNPNDIESVEVLKDAAATGIYGSRGANGVILITTNKAKINDDIYVTGNLGDSYIGLKILKKKIFNQ